jgi:hypothetical protein
MNADFSKKEQKNYQRFQRSSASKKEKCRVARKKDSQWRGDLVNGNPLRPSGTSPKYDNIKLG